MKYTNIAIAPLRSSHEEQTQCTCQSVKETHNYLVNVITIYDPGPLGPGNLLTLHKSWDPYLWFILDDKYV